MGILELLLQARAHSLLKAKDAELRTAAEDVRQQYVDQLAEAESAAADARSNADQVRSALQDVAMICVLAISTSGGSSLAESMNMLSNSETRYSVQPILMTMEPFISSGTVVGARACCREVQQCTGMWANSPTNMPWEYASGMPLLMAKARVIRYDSMKGPAAACCAETVLG